MFVLIRLVRRGGRGEGLTMRNCFIFLMSIGRQPFHLEVIGNRQKFSQFTLANVDLTIVHKVEQGVQVGQFDASQVKIWVVSLAVVTKDVFEEIAACCQDDHVGFDLK